MAKWKGYITFGIVDPAKLLEELAACFDQEDFEALKIEPARIFNASGAGRRDISVWNQNRTHVKNDAECQSKQFQYTEQYVLNYTGSPDDIRLAGGYQVDLLYQSAQGILVRSVIGAGELGPAIYEIPLFVGESAPIGSDYLDGGISCNRVLRSINGVTTEHFTIATETGVVVRSHPLLNRIVINVNGEGLNYCAGDVSNSTVDCLPASKPGCGPADGVAILCPGPPDDKGGYTDISQDVQSGNNNAGIDLNAIYGTCAYRKDIDGWSLQTANPSFNCVCSTPTTGGYLGQSLTTRARAIAGEPPYYVRNGSFLVGTEFWQITADSYELLTDELQFEGMPFLTIDNGVLSQPLIPLDARLIRVQAAYVCDATVTVRVLNVRTGALVLNQVFAATATQADILSDFFSTTGTDVTLTFITAGTLKIAEVGFVPWQ